MKTLLLVLIMTGLSGCIIVPHQHHHDGYWRDRDHYEDRDYRRDRDGRHGGYYRYRDGY